MTLPFRVALTGGGGRLGRALINELKSRPVEWTAWSRPEYDLDDRQAAHRLVARDRPALVLHAAAWTDVDGCTRDPELAVRRNGTAVAELANACVEHGAGLVLVSTNEVFDGARTDGRGYVEEDHIGPINGYGQSKLAGEVACRAAFAGARGAGLWIVRTAWLFGPPGNDFPTKIIAAADRLTPGAALRVVSDEVGSPTSTLDLARAILDLALKAPGGLYHLAASGHASRLEVAQAIVDRCRPGTLLEKISQNEFARTSTPPAWSVLDCSRAAGFGVSLRPWRTALRDYLGDIC
ncbi:MAG: NAD(P)-dependent oxidoreductase [Candidatus Limnocylindrales bacterium]